MSQSQQPPLHSDRERTLDEIPEKSQQPGGEEVSAPSERDRAEPLAK